MGTILKNKSNSPKCYVLSAPQHAGDLPAVRVAVPSERYDPTTGAREVKMVRRNLPTSVSLMPKGVEGDTSAPLPDWVRGIKQIVDDLRSGDVVLEDVADPEPAAAEAALAPSPAETEQPARVRRGDK